MADFVVDASATLVWCFRDEPVDWIETLFRSLISGREAIVPRHWAFEVANSFVIAMRRGRATRLELERAFHALRALPIYTDMTGDATVFTAMVNLAEKHRLSVYDAAYMELAMRSRLPLATLDDDLRAAAASAGIAVLK
ncbi:MAG: type II toxin-antitoxin system VapC family toxin [Candidatus Acidiferrum sp.]